jgi:hypothetical protein
MAILEKLSAAEHEQVGRARAHRLRLERRAQAGGFSPAEADEIAAESLARWVRYGGKVDAWFDRVAAERGRAPRHLRERLAGRSDRTDAVADPRCGDDPEAVLVAGIDRKRPSIPKTLTPRRAAALFYERTGVPVADLCSRKFTPRPRHGEIRSIENIRADGPLLLPECWIAEARRAVWHALESFVNSREWERLSPTIDDLKDGIAVLREVGRWVGGIDNPQTIRHETVRHLLTTEMLSWARKRNPGADTMAVAEAELAGFRALAEFGRMAAAVAETSHPRGHAGNKCDEALRTLVFMLREHRPRAPARPWGHDDLALLCIAADPHGRPCYPFATMKSAVRKQPPRRRLPCAALWELGREAPPTCLRCRPPKWRDNLRPTRLRAKNRDRKS